MWKSFVLLLLMSVSAQAGPWPRGAGQHFLSFSATSDEGTPGASLYHEWGLTETLTLISSASYSDGGQPSAMISASRVLFPGRNWRFAAAVGAGLHDGEAAGRIALSVGRDIRFLGFPGWLSAKAQATGTATKIEGHVEGTLGFTTPAGWKIYSQVFVTGNIHRPAPIIIDLRPVPFPGQTTIVITRYPPEIRSALSAAIPLGRQTWLDVGLSHGFQEGGTTRFKLGIWKEF